jgi:hypothetical protein
MTIELTKEQAETLETVIEILKETTGQHNIDELSFTTISDGFQISYTMTDFKPELHFKHLLKLSALFETVDINLNNYDTEGCKTCGAGATHTNTIELYNITKHKDLFESVIKQRKRGYLSVALIGKRENKWCITPTV